ncbi:ribonuclease H-like domain-containing protein [Natronorubrum sulfidifaciens]|uniref:YprB ribonuclease H-like domain-containing protein n=1 Tax=Natronorubrum sulfidifaciens JCM 14089 TaxID=1230460 RepID=L9WED8_9EURY|nr:ribonuclease H-like domain-containing protein [Natronorubrum sulfidifaciens]ELY46673.1 hypothetical protein C495_06183 [Natronorubrum sulfidifaciens JCM 14089]
MSQEQRFALDIETIPTCDNPDFGDPSNWSPFAVVLAHEWGDTADVSVLFRNGDSLESEARLYTRSLNWVATRLAAESVGILTYNGAEYDLPILRHRCETLDRELGTSLFERLESLEQRAEHIDLLQMVIAHQGHRMSIDDVLAMLMIDYDVPRWPDGRKVSGEDMLDIGPRIIAQDIDPDVLNAARRYATSDVAPLFDVYDALLRRRGIVED